MKPEIKTVNYEWTQCSSCGWIGKSEDAVLPSFGGLMSCPACSDLAVEEYHGAKTLEVPVDLLSDVVSKLCRAQLMVANPMFMGDYAKAEKNCICVVLLRLTEFMEASGIMPPERQEEPTPGGDRP